MKKNSRVIILGVLISIFFIAQDVMADSIEKLKDSEDYDSIYNIESQIVQFVNNGPTTSSGGRQITIEDVDLDNAVKEYLDTPLIENKLIDYAEVMDALNKSPYMWIVSIRADEVLYEACVTRERDENGQQTGPWGVEGVYVYEPGNLTLEEQLNASLEKNEIGINAYQLFLVGGVAPIRQPLFMALDNERILYVIPARTSAAAMITDSSKTRSNIYSDEELEPSDPDGFQAYDFKSVMQAAANVPDTFGQGGGSAVIDIGKKSQPIAQYVITASAVIVFIIFGVIFLRRKKFKNKYKL